MMMQPSASLLESKTMRLSKTALVLGGTLGLVLAAAPAKAHWNRWGPPAYVYVPPPPVYYVPPPRVVYGPPVLYGPPPAFYPPPPPVYGPGFSIGFTLH
jgi:hypothetical protein